MENKIKYFSILLMFLAWGCYKEPNVLQNQVILKMSNHDSIPADGISKVLITIELDPATTDANNAVTFVTTKGLFDIVAKNTVTASAQRVTINGNIHKVASVYLSSTTDEGFGYVTATLKNYSQTDTVNFIRAYPDKLRLLVDKLNYQAGNSELTVTVQLKRNTGTGTPSTAQIVSLIAVDSMQKIIGSFRNFNNITDASGSCINYFSLPTTTTYLGKVQFQASAQKAANGFLVSDTTTINVYK